MERKVIVSDAGDGMAEIRLNRPDKRNAIDFDVMNELERFLMEYEANPEIRGVILTGEGDAAFCSGGDLSAFHALKTEEEAYSMLSRMGKILYRLATFPAPVIALLNGTAVGGGCELAMAADIRYAREGIRMGFIQGTLAITTGWGGGSLLMERVHTPASLKILCSSRLYETEVLCRKGMIDDMLPVSGYREEGIRSIKAMLADHPGVTRSYKAISVQKLIQGNLWGRMELEIRRCARLWAKEDHHQAVDLFLKRKMSQ
ncbi:enoyl-CoA hydratase/isomerase family protein [Bacillus sp. FJAT-42376]|uniref:enoyl-CoA hydratase/isomerase family protein n=1 Tax=Bacillus sp. FJAT-42376 TaxID=2014076 RepID=UPI000F50C848|nr:enoyl-CoA hydratase/isomerase family protein [Bacillus sp. FJAT-42376]AZB42824.1 enoyl-CoA hydratase/isomerase family protein [Bacillus sp. FJAT-42376]